MLSVAVQSVVLLSAILLSVIMLGVIILCHFSKFLYAQYNGPNKDTAERFITFMLSVVILSIFTLSVTMLYSHA
jgi:hypothetical protein